MAKLTFNFDGQSYVSDVFSGGKVVQLVFPAERTKVLYLETRLNSGLPWKTAGRHVLEKQLVVNVPSGGEGQEFRMNCLAEPALAEIVTANSMGSDQIPDGSIQEEDLSDDVRRGLDELNNISLTDEDVENWFDDDPNNDDDSSD